MKKTTGTSVKLSKQESDPLERWDTPQQTIEAHCALVRSLFGPTQNAFCSPFAGDGRYMAEIKGDTWSADAEPRGADVLRACFDDPSLDYTGRVVVDNPAFSHAYNAIIHAFAHGAIGVSFLLPISFLDPFVQKRRALNTNHPPAHEMRIGRIRFEGPARDAHIARKGAAPGAMMQYVFASWARYEVPLSQETYVQALPLSSGLPMLGDF